MTYLASTVRPRDRVATPPIGYRVTEQDDAATEPAAIEPSERPDPVRVVGIGPSAGGLAALKTLFAQIPDDTGLAYVVVMHLSREHESHLAELLQPHVRMPVQQVTETVPIDPDHVYVIPPNANLNTIDTHLRLSELEANRGERGPIDHFLRTLAQAHGSESVGIVLTGTGSDGTLGVREIHEQGGLTIAQEPSDAEYDGMPRSAVATGLVDLVTPLRRIPEALLSTLRTSPRLQVPVSDDLVPTDELRQLHDVLAQVRIKTGRDFARYKRTTVLRRIHRRMQLQRTELLEDYLGLLRAEPDEVHALADDLLVTVTSFFRDPEIFDVIERRIVPSLLEGKGPEDIVRVWAVGCATGEEVYSLAMLLLEATGRMDAPPRLQLFASDLHQGSLAIAREGLYTGDISSDVTAARLQRFFTEEEGGYRVRQHVRELVVFSPHNLLSDPPFSRIDLISCRNLLIYLDREIQAHVIELFHYALRSEGFLTLGSSETIDAGELFATFDKKRSLYRRRDVPGPEPRLPVFPMSAAKTSEVPRGLDRTPERARYGVAHQRVLERYGPPSLLVDVDDRVVHLSDTVGRYLTHPGGQMTSNVFKLVREDLRIELRSAMHEARRSGRPVRSAPASVDLDGHAATVVLDVRPAVAREDDGYVLVVFTEHERTPGQEPTSAEADGVELPTAATGDGHRKHDAEAERYRLKQRLQASIEQYETVQEELRASNEELQSSNEELRSTLEELETSKEELQSMNEELQTVNQENRHKVEELSQLSGDLHNLLTASDIATLFLDRDLRIMRFTPRVTDLFNIRAPDRGRPISDITHRLRYDGLQADAEQVMARLIPVERELVDERERWFLTNILPYRSAEDRIEGTVLTFVDITAHKRVEAALVESEGRFHAIMNASSEALYRMNPDWTEMRQLTSRGFLTETSAPNERWSELYLDREDRSEIGAAIGEAIRTKGTFELEHRVRRADGQFGWVLSRAVPLLDEDGEILEWVGAASDITERKRVEHDQREREQSLEHGVEERTRQVRELSRTLILAEQRERQRLSRVLHDDLQQLLYSVQMKVSLAQERGEDDDVAGVLEQTPRTIELLDEAIARTRQLTVDLNPPILDGEGLLEAVDWLRVQMHDLHDIEVEVRATGDVAVTTPDLRILLFQVVRELLFNVAKHARTDRAVVELVTDDEQVRITVTDHGLGFDVERLSSSDEGARGLGLISVQERLRMIGGDLDIHSVPGDGTRLSIRAPLDGVPDESQDLR